jgi:hypothetical protein
MAFATTGLLDAFTGADNTALPAHDANWTNAVGTIHIISNTATAATSAPRSIWELSYGPSTEAYVTISTKGQDGQWIGLFSRLTTLVNATTDGYAIYLDTVTGAGNDSWSVQRIDNGANTQIGASATREVASRDKLGIEIISSTIKGYIFNSGSWTEIISRSDSTYSSAGYAGMEISDNTWRIDDFSGGTVVVAAAIFRTLALLGVG